MRHETIIMKRGLTQIDIAPWEEDKHGCLNLYVMDKNGRDIHCFMQLRPQYCDRGHIQLNIDGIPALDGADRFPRYFFSFQEADHHCRTFLKWRLWQQRTYQVGPGIGWGDTGKTEVKFMDPAPINRTRDIMNELVSAPKNIPSYIELPYEDEGKTKTARIEIVGR